MDNNQKRTQEYYKMNLEALKKNRLELYNRVVSYKSKGHITLNANSDGKTFNIYDVNQKEFYYPPVNPLQEVKAQTDSLNLKNTRMALFLGFGLGYQYIYFAQTIAQKQRTRYVFIVEHDMEKFILALYASDLRTMINNPHIMLYIDMASDEIFVRIRNEMKITNVMLLVKAVQVIYSPYALKYDKEYYMNVLAGFKEATINTLKYVGNDPNDSLIGIRNMFKNINVILENPGIALQFDKFKNIPIVVVSSGPSLKKNMHLLNDIKDKALIICAESTFRILMKAGIKPHMVTSLERTDRTISSFDDFENDDLNDVFLASTPVIPNQVYQIYHGPKIIVYRNYDHFKWLEIEKGILDIKQSSANMAFKIADAMGGNPIILIGQDLAFEKGSRVTHAENHIKGSSHDRYQREEIFEVKGNVDDTVETSSSWHLFLQSFVLDIAEFKGTVVNATEGGAFIQGTNVMSFKEAITKYMTKDYDIVGMIKDNNREFTKDILESEKHRVYEKMKQAITDIENISLNCHKGMEYVETVSDRLKCYIEKDFITEEDRKDIMKTYEEVNVLKNKVQHGEDTFQKLVMHVAQSYYVKFEIDMGEVPSKYEDFDQSLAEIVLHQPKWFGNINNIAIKVLEDLMMAKEAMENEL